MKYYLFLFLLLSLSVSRAQVSFEKIIYDTGNIGIDVMVLSDSSILTLTASNVIIKSDSLGHILWSKNITGVNSNDLGPVKFLKTTDGQIVLLNQYYITSLIYGANILKIDTSGNILWSKSFSKKYPQSIAETEDKGFIISAKTPDTLIGTEYFNRQLIKLDSIGDHSWTQAYTKDTVSNGDSRILQMSDGGYMGVYAGFPYMELIITDSAGNILHSNAISSGYSTLQDFIEINSNAYLILLDRMMSCVDSTGSLVWTRDLSGNFSEYHDADRINDSLVVIAGRDYYIDIKAGLFWINSSGVVLRNEYYHNVSGDVSRAYGASTFPGGGYVLTGESMITFGQVSRILLIRTDTNDLLDCEHVNIGLVAPIIADSSVVPTVHNVPATSNLMNDTISSISYNVNFFDECFTYVASQSGFAKNKLITLFPNPTSFTFTIQLNSQFQNADVEIFNLLGEKVFNVAFTGLLTVDCQHFPPGLYFVKLQTEKGSVVEKLIIHK